MIKEGKFGTQEAVWLTVIIIGPKIFFTSPATIASIVGTASWYMTLISAAVALIGFGFIVKLLKRFPNKDLTEIFELSLGRVAGFAVSIILGSYLMYLAAMYVAEFHEVLAVYVYPRSPHWYITLIFVVSVIVISIKGLETMARLAKIIALFAVPGFILVLLLSIENYNLYNLFPIFGYGLDKTVVTGLLRSSSYGEVVVLAIFARSLQGTKYVKKAGIIGLVISAFFISSGLLAFTLTFPHHVSMEITSAMYEMATLIDYGRFVQRVEPIFLFIWIITSLLSTTVIFYSFIWIFCKIFRINDKKPIVIAGGVILYASSLMHRDIASIIFGGIQLTRTIGFIPFFGLPLIALIVAVIRKKGGKEVA